MSIFDDINNEVTAKKEQPEQVVEQVEEKPYQFKSLMKEGIEELNLKRMTREELLNIDKAVGGAVDALMSREKYSHSAAVGIVKDYLKTVKVK